MTYASYLQLPYLFVTINSPSLVILVKVFCYTSNTPLVQFSRLPQTALSVVTIATKASVYYWLFFARYQNLTEIALSFIYFVFTVPVAIVFLRPSVGSSKRQLWRQKPKLRVCTKK